MAIIVERTEDDLFVSKSDNSVKIRPILDRLGKEISQHAIYDVAVDVAVNDEPRYDYVETAIPIEIVNEDEREDEINPELD